VTEAEGAGEGVDVDVDAYEREMMARFDAEMAAMTEQGRRFQQQFDAMMAAWQPVPPQMFSQYADGLERWSAHHRNGAGPAAEWLASAGRPTLGQRLAAVVDDLGKAVTGYRQMAGQQVAHMNGLGQIQTGMYSQQLAGQREIGQIRADTNREINEMWAKGQAESTAAFERQNALFRKSL
jgi:hypothetical protein